MAWLIVLSPVLLAVVGALAVYTSEVWYIAPHDWAAKPTTGAVVELGPKRDLQKAA
jgi:hypothetical protein